MANVRLTLRIDEDIVRRARIKALEHGTSVDRILRDYLTAWVGADAERIAAAERVLAVAERVRSGSSGRTWTRDELHER